MERVGKFFDKPPKPSKPPRRKPGRPPDPKWVECLNDGDVYAERRGEHFQGTLQSRRTYLHLVARRHGAKVTTETYGDEIRFQFRRTP